MKEEFPDWFGSQTHQRHVDNDLGVSITNELFALACGPTLTLISINSCVINGMRFVVHSRDECRTTQNSNICSPGGKDEEMYYGPLQEIIEFSYFSFKVVLFRVKWFDTSNEGRKVKHLVLRNNMTQILTKGEAFKVDQYILATQVKQCFYLEDMARRQPQWKVVQHVNHKKFLDEGVIVVEEDPDMVNQRRLTHHQDIIVLDEDDDIIDDEDALPHDLADSNDEDLVNVVDDDDVDMSADVARGHGGNGGGDDHPPTHHIPIDCGGCFANRVNGMRFVVHSRDECRTTQNNSICSPSGKDGDMYYGPLQEIIEFSYFSFKVVLFRVKWFDTSNEGRKVKHLVLRNNMTQILTKGEAFKVDQYIFATQVKQCFYLEDMARRQPQWKVVQHVNHKKFLDGGVIVVEEDPDMVNQRRLTHRQDIIVLDEDDDIIDDEDALPHDLADFNDEDLVNVDDDDDVDMWHGAKAVTVAVMIVPLHIIYPSIAGVASLTEAKAPENPIWTEGKRAGCIPARRPGTSVLCARS
nr:hypothetical protein [Tanacetum cinerariifolium]